MAEIKENQKEIEKLNAQISKQQVNELLNKVKDIKGVKVLALEVAASDMNNLRSLADMFRDKLGSGVVVLGTKNEDKVNFVATVTKDLVQKGIHAGNIIREVAKKAGGGGGGRPDMAQAGGKDVTQLQAALDLVENLVSEQLK